MQGMLVLIPDSLEREFQLEELWEYDVSWSDHDYEMEMMSRRIAATEYNDWD